MGQGERRAPRRANAGSLRIRDRELLRRLRLSLNISQSELAERVGVSRGAISHWESGKRPTVEATYADRLADALGQPIRSLFERR